MWVKRATEGTEGDRVVRKNEEDKGEQVEEGKEKEVFEGVGLGSALRGFVIELEKIEELRD